MPASIIKAVKKVLLTITLLCICTFLWSFKVLMSEQEWISWGNRFFTEAYDASVEPKLKKYEISLTPDHFIRLRKTYQHGKQEYFSFNLQRFNTLGYKPGQGNTDTITVSTRTDDIIVQTYNDPEGDVDSMATTLNLPVKKMPAQKLDSLKQALAFLKEKQL